MALELRRFNERHDNVLKVILDYLQVHYPPEYEILADLPRSTYSFPSSTASTDLRPDLVLWSDTRRVVILAELTVCFETNFVDACQRKTVKYQDLVEACKSTGFSTNHEEAGEECPYTLVPGTTYSSLHSKTNT